MTGARATCDVDVERLPAVIHHVGSSELRRGPLYLPNPYVLPGDTLNAMYGWDRDFIILASFATAISRSPAIWWKTRF